VLYLLNLLEDAVPASTRNAVVLAIAAISGNCSF
jgi:hypothetical protein